MLCYPPPPRNCDYVSCCCPKLVSGLPTSVPLSAHLTILFCISDEVQLLVTSARIFWLLPIPVGLPFFFFFSFPQSKSYRFLQVPAMTTWLSLLPWIPSVHESAPGDSSWNRTKHFIPAFKQLLDLAGFPPSPTRHRTATTGSQPLCQVCPPHKPLLLTSSCCHTT